MPLGRRKYLGLVIHDGDWQARFAPIDLASTEEFLTEAKLAAQIASDPAAASPEDMLAVNAFKARRRNQGTSRAAMLAAHERASRKDQGVGVAEADVLEPSERATVERWRGIIGRETLPVTVDMESDSRRALKSSRHDFLDGARDVLRIIDKYLPRPLATKAPR